MPTLTRLYIVVHCEGVRRVARCRAVHGGVQLAVEPRGQSSAISPDHHAVFRLLCGVRFRHVPHARSVAPRRRLSWCNLNIYVLGGGEGVY